MQADSATKRENRYRAPNPLKHVTRLGKRYLKVNFNDVAMISLWRVQIPGCSRIQVDALFDRRQQEH